MTEPEPLEVYASVKEYCEKYNIPLENLMDILEDQKVSAHDTRKGNGIYCGCRSLANLAST